MQESGHLRYTTLIVGPEKSLYIQCISCHLINRPDHAKAQHTRTNPSTMAWCLGLMRQVHTLLVHASVFAERRHPSRLCLLIGVHIPSPSSKSAPSRQYLYLSYCDFVLVASTMAILTVLRNFVMGDPDEFGEAGTHVTGSTERPKHDENGREYLESEVPVQGDQIDDAQRGVQNIQATTMAWTKTSLATLLILYVL
jgi:hypothetical protein